MRNICISANSADLMKCCILLHFNSGSSLFIKVPLQLKGFQYTIDEIRSLLFIIEKWMQLDILSSNLIITPVSFQGLLRI